MVMIREWYIASWSSLDISIHPRITRPYAPCVIGAIHMKYFCYKTTINNVSNPAPVWCTNKSTKQASYYMSLVGSHPHIHNKYAQHCSSDVFIVGTAPYTFIVNGNISVAQRIKTDNRSQKGIAACMKILKQNTLISFTIYKYQI